MSKMMKRGIFMFFLLLAVSIGIIYYTIDLDALKAISSFNSWWLQVIDTSSTTSYF